MNDIRQEIAEALSPSAFNHNHPDYSCLSHRFAREEAFEFADRVLPVLQKALQQSAEGDVESLGSFEQYLSSDAQEAAEKALRKAGQGMYEQIDTDLIVKALQDNGWRYEG